MNFARIVMGSCLFMAVSGVAVADDDKAKDAKVNTDVKAKITSTTNVPAVDAPNVVVYTKDGKVKIVGVVDTKTQKNDIEKVVKTVDGVKDIDTTIEVRD